MISDKEIKEIIEEKISWLESYRKAKNYSKDKMGSLLHVSRQTYDNWQNKIYPNVYNWIRITNFINNEVSSDE